MLPVFGMSPLPKVYPSELPRLEFPAVAAIFRRAIFTWRFTCPESDEEVPFTEEQQPAYVLVQTLRRQFMPGHREPLSITVEQERALSPVKGRVAAMHGAVMVGADEHHILQVVQAATAKPLHMVGFAKVCLVPQPG